VASAAGLATLKGCTPAVYDRLGVVSKAIADAASAEFSRHGIPHVVQWAGSMFSVFFREGPVTNYDEARTQQVRSFSAFFQSMLSQGVHLPPSAFETWFVSASHDDAAIDRVLAALPAAAQAVTDSFAEVPS
jgi:Glutamate-1-semialdehyde aminotransferase